MLTKILFTILTLISVQSYAVDLPPPVVKNIQVLGKATATTGPLVVWDQVEEAVSYEVGVGTIVMYPNFSDWVNVGNSLAYQASALNFSEATTYYYFIRVVNDNGSYSLAEVSSPWQL